MEAYLWRMVTTGAVSYGLHVDSGIAYHGCVFDVFSALVCDLDQRGGNSSLACVESCGVGCGCDVLR